MAERPFRTEAMVAGDDVVVAVEGELDIATVAQVTAVVEDAIAARGGAGHLLLDLSGVAFVDSSGLTTLVKANRRAGEEGMSFAIRSPSDRVRRTLELTRLDAVFRIE